MTVPQGRNPRSGVDDFFGVLRDYSKIIAWTFGAAVAPIAAGMVKLAPPWPPSVIQITAIFEILTLVLAFQLLKKTRLAVVNRVMIVCFIASITLVLAYLILISMFVYEEPISKERFIKGFSCTINAMKVFPNHCPFYGDDDLRDGEWEASRFWLPWSITVVRISIVAAWSCIFISLAATIGSFLVYQSSVRARSLT